MNLKLACLHLDQVGATLSVRHHDGRQEQYGPLPESERYPMFAPGNNLVDVIVHREKNGSPGTLGARVVQVLDAAYRSARREGEVIVAQES